MEPFLTDGDLLSRSTSEPTLFAELYERHGRALRRYVVRRVGVEVAEDLVADVFVRAFRARGRYREQHENALPWLLGVANHVVADHRRSERRRLAALEQLARATPQLVEDDHAGLAPELLRELRRLPTPDRDALLLVVWGELSYEEAARALGVPLGTVSSRIARARRRLAQAIRARPSSQPSDLHLQGEANA